jgi:hypothetical protein
MKGKMILKDGNWFVAYETKKVATHLPVYGDPVYAIKQAPLHPSDMEYLYKMHRIKLIEGKQVEFELIKDKSLPRIDIHYAKLTFKSDKS